MNIFQKHPFGAYVVSAGHIIIFALLLGYYVYLPFENSLSGPTAPWAYVFILLLYSAGFMLIYERVNKFVMLIFGGLCWVAAFILLMHIVSHEFLGKW